MPVRLEHALLAAAGDLPKDCAQGLLVRPDRLESGDEEGDDQDDHDHLQNNEADTQRLGEGSLGGVNAPDDRGLVWP